MIKNIISRYHPRYVRSLVYMLQACEYKISDYVVWLHRVEDFNVVEKRKQLTKSSKALLLLVLGYALWTLLIGLGVFIILTVSAWYSYVFGVMIILTAPFLLAYLILLSLLCIQLLQKPVESIIVNRARETLAKHPGLKIAIAGSYGKTTMREILKTVLAEGKTVAAPPHSYNTPLGISRFVQGLSGDEDVLIFELGEYYPGDVRTLCELVGPDMGIITGINEAHLEKFKTLERTTQTIFELADYLGDRPLYINGESELARKHAQPGHRIYDQNGIGAWQVVGAKTDLSGTSFTLEKGAAELSLQSELLGLHQVGPLATAAVIAKEIGISEVDIRAGIKKTKPFAHRLEPRTDDTGVTILDDSYNGNPDGVRAVITFLATLEGRRFYVTPGLVEMGRQTKSVHQAIGRQLAQAGVENVILIKNSVTPYIEQGLIDNQYTGTVLWFDDAFAAFAALPHLTVKGDIIVLQNDWPDQYA